MSLVKADIDGAFPEGFYSTTNQRTQIRVDGEWIDVNRQEMDCGIKFIPESKTAECIPMTNVRQDDLIAVGNAGARVFPEGRSKTHMLSNS